MTSRRDFIKASGVVASSVAVGSTSAAAAESDVVDPVGAELAGWLESDISESRIVQHDGVPTWIVSTSDSDAVVSWADGSSSRTVLDSGSRSVVAAPAGSVVSSTMSVTSGGALEELSGVDSINVNVRFSEPSPVTSLEAESEVGLSWMERVYGYNRSGVAFGGDMEKTDMSVARSAVGADSVSETGAGVTVAVIDTGLNLSGGSVFGSRVLKMKNHITGNTGESAVQDDNGHGTWCASAIAADPDTSTSDEALEGVAPDADLLISKSLNSDGGESADIADAIRWAADNGADIISMSLGSPIYTEEIVAALRYAIENGVTSIPIAAGNSRQTVRYLASPADAPVSGVVGVGAVTADPASDAQSAYFSQVSPDDGIRDMSDGETAGQMVDVAAPGTKITAQTVATDGTVTTSTLSGTSMSTPIVSGVVALALESNTGWVGEPSTVSDWISRSARPVPNAGVTEVGAGMVAADRLVSQTEASSSQSESRDTAAKSRDTTNRVASSDGMVGKLLRQA